MIGKIKRRTFEILEAATDGDKASKVFDLFILTLILVNVVMVIAETFSLPQVTRQIFYYIELVSVILFTIEYVLRVWTSDLLRPDVRPAVARVKFTVSFMALIDLLAILPFYVPFLLPIDLRVLRMLRIVRLFRVFKVNRYTNALSTIGAVFRTKKSQLLSSIFMVVLLMIVAAVLMYNVENTAQPDTFANAFDALWWAVATLTTVGYGDIYPVTAAGKLLSAVIALLGIGLVAVPTGIISAGFVEEIDREKQDEKHFCPYCGHDLK